jgi:hypothetical protein
VVSSILALVLLGNVTRTGSFLLVLVGPNCPSKDPLLKGRLSAVDFLIKIALSEMIFNLKTIFHSLINLMNIICNLFADLISAS